jgi:tetratricopeptide (TPR) repeat protein
VELRRELAYLLLRMDRQSAAEEQFGILVKEAPDDLLAATQLGFLLYARGEHDAAQPLFDRVLAGNDEDWRIVCAPFCASRKNCTQPGPNRRRRPRPTPK